MDVARTAIRKGVEHLTCFSITKEVAASHYEFSYAQLEGVQFEYNKRPVEIKDNGVIFIDVIEMKMVPLQMLKALKSFTKPTARLFLSVRDHRTVLSIPPKA